MSLVNEDVDPPFRRDMRGTLVETVARLPMSRVDQVDEDVDFFSVAICAAPSRSGDVLVAVAGRNRCIIDEHTDAIDRQSHA